LSFAGKHKHKTELMLGCERTSDEWRMMEYLI
jgi:hypothetical protein